MATGNGIAGDKPCVLVVDDEAGIRSVLRRALGARGFEVVEAADGEVARERLSERHYDVVLTDISMPGMDGIGVLRMVRQTDLDVPVILITGAPDYETVLEAMNLGAMKYITKPFELDELVSVVTQAEQMHRLARLERESLRLLGGVGSLAADRAGLEATFQRALSGVWMAFQPIVDYQGRRVHGYEALLRTEDSVLNSPLAVLDAAERLQQIHPLGRLVRRRVAAHMDDVPIDALVFVNLHPADLEDDDLLDPRSPLSDHAERIVLEITERAKLGGIDDVSRRVAKLRDLGFRIAVDDLGAGYSGLGTYVQLSPDLVKLDGALVNGVAQDSRRQGVVSAMLDLSRRMGNQVILEGVETMDDVRTVVAMGANLLQGYALARPGRPFPEVPAAVYE